MGRKKITKAETIVCAAQPIKWKPGDERVRQGYWTSQYTPEYDDIAACLVGSGFDEQDLAHRFDVPTSAIKGWKRSFPSFKKACNDGKRGQLKRLVSNSFKEATGYDWIATKTTTTYSADGSKTVTVQETPMHQAGNATLATFMMCNLSNQLKLADEEAFKSKQKVEVENKNLSINITAELVGEQIDRLAGKLLSGNTKQIEAEVIEQGEED